MKIFATLILFFASISISFGQLTSESMDVNGVNREYVQYLPIGFDSSAESLPLVLILHGIGGTALDISGYGFNSIADNGRCVTIYPQGLPNANGYTAWANGTLLESTADDVSFMKNIIAQKTTDLNIDPSRVYVIGISMGGIMSYSLACEMNDQIAAICAMSGPMSTETLNNCNPQYVTPVMHIHGTNDDVVPYDTNPLPSLSLVPQTMIFWEAQHNCIGAPDSIQIANTASDGYTVDRFVYTNCDTPGALELWRVNGGMHTYFYEPVNDFTAGVEAWNFLNQWSLPEPASIKSIDSEEFVIYPNPGTGIFSIELDHQDQLSVYTASGQQVHEQILNAGLNSVDVQHLSSGMYFFKLGSSSIPQRVLIQ